MYAPVHHGNNPVLYSNYMFKGKGRNRPFRAPGKFAVRVGVPLIGKLIKGISKQQRRQKRSRRKLRKLKSGNFEDPILGGPFGKIMATIAGLSKAVDKKIAAKRK